MQATEAGARQGLLAAASSGCGALLGSFLAGPGSPHSRQPYKGQTSWSRVNTDDVESWQAGFSGRQQAVCGASGRGSTQMGIPAGLQGVSLGPIAAAAAGLFLLWAGWIRGGAAKEL